MIRKNLINIGEPIYLLDRFIVTVELRFGSRYDKKIERNLYSLCHVPDTIKGGKLCSCHQTSGIPLLVFTFSVFTNIGRYVFVG
jgi:hypothetical protein